MWISGLPGTFSPGPGSLTGSSQRFMTTCNGGQATRGIQSAAELQPELMPNEYYLFAIERNSTGYTMEVSGNFVRAGAQTIRLHRPFEVDGEPIWHYNTRADEYDGRHNADLMQENWAHGSYVWPDLWPVGSRYPDWFVIGDPYTNVYEGTASITDIRLYTSVRALDPLVGSSSMPFPLPTIPPTVEPTSSPTGEGATSEPTMREVEIDPNGPTETFASTACNRARNFSLLTALSLMFFMNGAV
jgi:hypothetical protein